MMAEKMLQQILHRLDHMEKHFDRTETQLDQVNTEITMLKETMATKESVETSINELKETMATKESVETNINELKETMATIESVEASISELKETMATKESVEASINELKETMATKGDLDALRQSIEQIDKNQQEDILSLLQVMNRKMDTVSESIDYLTQKFIEHDQAIYVLQKRVGTG